MGWPCPISASLSYDGSEALNDGRIGRPALIRRGHEQEPLLLRLRNADRRMK
jgi:hypothetical protein